MNTEFCFPSELELKIIKNESDGGKPENVYLSAPSLINTGEKFQVKISITGSNGFAARDCEDLIVLSEELPDFSRKISFKTGQSLICAIKNVSIDNEGFYRFKTELNGKNFYSNPIYCLKENDIKIFWGDPHVHTILSNCGAERSRTLNYCFTAARHLSGLDWVSAADHVSNGRCDFSKWKEESNVSNLYNDPPEFVTLPAYEASLRSGSGGDNNVYMERFPEMYVDEYESGNTKTLVEKLREKMDNSEFFIVPHHTTRADKHGEIPHDIYPGKNMMPLLEIHSKWGTSEFKGNPGGLLKQHNGPSYAVDLLGQGLPLGFIGGTDSHATMPAIFAETESEHISSPPGLTAVFAEKLTRKSIFKALKNRKCYASSLDRNILIVETDGDTNGTFKKLSATPPRFKALIAGKADITEIALIRNGSPIKRWQSDGWHATVEYEDSDNPGNKLIYSPFIGKFIYYYFRARFSNGASAWSGPVWFLAE